MKFLIVIIAVVCTVICYACCAAAGVAIGNERIRWIRGCHRARSYTAVPACIWTFTGGFTEIRKEFNYGTVYRN